VHGILINLESARHDTTNAGYFYFTWSADNPVDGYTFAEFLKNLGGMVPEPNGVLCISDYHFSSVWVQMNPA